MKTQKGFTLIELMTAIILALLITAAISMVYISNQKTYRLNEVNARYQETMRYALEQIAHDIRMAGHQGCNAALNPDNSSQPLNIQINSEDPFLRYTQGIGGYTAMNPPVTLNNTAIHPNTDILWVQYASGQSWRLTQDMNSTNDTIKIASKTDELVNAPIILYISDCTAGDQFVATGINQDSSSNTTTLVHGAGDNKADYVSRIYSRTAEVMKAVSHLYYIKPANSTDNQRPALWRKTLGNGLSSTEEEIAEDIVDLRLRYGIDTDADGYANQYVSAESIPSTDWHKVVAVQVCLGYESSDEQVGEKSSFSTGQSYQDCLGNSQTPNDQRFHKTNHITVSVRNRTP